MPLAKNLRSATDPSTSTNILKPLALRETCGASVEPPRGTMAGCGPVLSEVDPPTRASPNRPLGYSAPELTKTRSRRMQDMEPGELQILRESPVPKIPVSSHFSRVVTEGSRDPLQRPAATNDELPLVVRHMTATGPPSLSPLSARA